MEDFLTWTSGISARLALFSPGAYTPCKHSSGICLASLFVVANVRFCFGLNPTSGSEGRKTRAGVDTGGREVALSGQGDKALVAENEFHVE